MSSSLKASRKRVDTKFIKYAIGEIALVVIGILIALSINNWNQTRKDQRIEKKIIEEMIISLASDANLFSTLKRRLSDKIQAIQQLLQYKDNSLSLTEDELNENIYLANQMIAYTYDDSPYEALVSLGIDKFSDDVLLNKIIYYYSTRLPRSEQLIRDALDYHIPRINELEQRAVDEGLFIKSFVKNANDEYEVEFSNQTRDLFKSKTFNQFLVRNYQLYEDLIYRVEQVANTNHELYEALTE